MANASSINSHMVPKVNNSYNVSIQKSITTLCPVNTLFYRISLGLSSAKAVTAVWAPPNSRTWEPHIQVFSLLLLLGALFSCRPYEPSPVPPNLLLGLLLPLVLLTPWSLIPLLPLLQSLWPPSA